MGNNFKKAGWFLLSIAFVAIPLFVVWQQRYSILDYIKLLHYQAPPAVALLASQDTMTAKGRKLFYVNHPQIVSDKSVFATDCSVGEQAIVEGCYHSGENGIFIFDVRDKALTGIQQVTAAHEMLHGAYEQLSGPEKKNVNSQLLSYYQNGLTSNRVRNEINLYQKTEPDAWVDEMHSVFGTEVGSLPASLEKYYSQYFTSRMRVVSYSSQYESQFTSRQAKVQAYDQQLSALRAQISSLKTELESESAQISADRSSLNQLATSGDSKRFNSAVSSFKQEVADYNQKVTQYNSMVDQFNEIIKERNALAIDLNNLTSEIDTRPSLQSSL